MPSQRLRLPPRLSRVPKEQASRGTYEDTQKQRYLERQVRKWKRHAAVALDDDQRRAANAKVRAYQARIRELTADTGLPRKSRANRLQRLVDQASGCSASSCGPSIEC
ncbi:phage minor capsid protein [Streptomyces sp. SGAir0957]